MLLASVKELVQGMIYCCVTIIRMALDCFEDYYLLWSSAPHGPANRSVWSIGNIYSMFYLVSPIDLDFSVQALTADITAFRNPCFSN